MMDLKHCTSISDLTNASVLEPFSGPVSNVNRTLLSGIGYSGSTLERVDVTTISGLKQSFILKQTNLSTDWISQRTKDIIGREAAVLAEPLLAEIWGHVHRPYVAFAIEKGQMAVLMNDLTPYLFPDVREPINAKTEAAILDTLASLHAAFWKSPKLDKINWLGQPIQYLELLGQQPYASDAYAPPPEKLGASVIEGWKAAMELLPDDVKKLFSEPVEKMPGYWKYLPTTFLHGDVKLSNMALMPDGTIAAFDWALTGHGPCSIDLGWYIAVNATRLARTKEEVIAIYRRCLESHLHYSVEEQTWERLEDLAIFSGAKMLLWNKALTYKSGTEQAKSEWDWWVQRLQNVAARI